MDTLATIISILQVLVLLLFYERNVLLVSVEKFIKLKGIKKCMNIMLVARAACISIIIGAF